MSAVEKIREVLWETIKQKGYTSLLEIYQWDDIARSMSFLIEEEQGWRPEFVCEKCGHVHNDSSRAAKD